MNIEVITKNEYSILIEKISNIENWVSKLVTGATIKKNEYYTVNETCKILKVSIRTLQNYRDQGLIKFSQIGAKILFSQEDIQKFISKHVVN